MEGMETGSFLLPNFCLGVSTEGGMCVGTQRRDEAS